MATGFTKCQHFDFQSREVIKSVQDNKFVKNMISDIGIESDVNFITRIGEPCNGKIRPIKAVTKKNNCYQEWLIEANLLPTNLYFFNDNKKSSTNPSKLRKLLE